MEGITSKKNFDFLVLIEMLLFLFCLVFGWSEGLLLRFFGLIEMCIVFAVCCSVVQCVAVCCSVLQYVAVFYSVLQCVAVCCSVLQCVAVCCSVLQFVCSCVVSVS